MGIPTPTSLCPSDVANHRRQKVKRSVAFWRPSAFAWLGHTLSKPHYLNIEIGLHNML